MDVTSLTIATLVPAWALMLLGAGVLGYGAYWLYKKVRSKNFYWLNSWKDFFSALRQSIDNQEKARDKKERFIQDFNGLIQEIEGFNRKYEPKDLIITLQSLPVIEVKLATDRLALAYQQYTQANQETLKNIADIEANVLNLNITEKKVIGVKYTPSSNSSTKTEEEKTVRVSVEPPRDYSNNSDLDDYETYFTEMNVNGVKSTQVFTGAQIKALRNKGQTVRVTQKAKN